MARWIVRLDRKEVCRIDAPDRKTAEQIAKQVHHAATVVSVASLEVSVDPSRWRKPPRAA
jgi:hypothetical protein